MQRIHYIIGMLLFCGWAALTPQPATSQERATVKRATLKGKVFTADGQPAAGVTVTLEDSRTGASTNASGTFEIPGVPYGTHTIRVSGVGLRAQSREVNVQSAEVTVPDFNLAEDAATLKEVIVRANRANPFTRKRSDYVAKIPLKNLENPQVYTTITQELMKSQVVTSFNDALVNSSGLDKLWNATGRGGDGTGYYSLRGFATQASMVNGIASISNSSPDPANIEQIEVMKGPSGTLYGGAIVNFGGLINIVTKRPTDTLGGSLDYTGGSFGEHRVAADIHSPLTRNRQLTARLNAAYHRKGSFQDAGWSESIFIAPSLQYQPHERLTVNLDAEIYHYEGTNPLMVFLNRARQLTARTPSELAFDFNRSYTVDDVTVKNPSTNLRGQVSYKLSDAWIANTHVNYSRRKSDGYYQYVMYLEPDNDTLISHNVADLHSISNVVNIQQNFQGDFHIGPLRNRLVAGLDFLHQNTTNDNSPYVVFDKYNTAIDDPRYGNFTREAITSAIASSTQPGTHNHSMTNVYSAYLANVVDVTGRLNIMIGLRADRFHNRGLRNLNGGDRTGAYLQTAFSPKVGIVYQLLKDRLSLFGNYMNGFRNVAPVTQPLPDISGIFDPQRANQLEGGVKLDAFQNRLTFTASYYDINVTNVTRSEQVERDGQFYNITVQDGEQLSRGFELDLVARPVEGLNLSMGYSNNFSKLTKANASVNNRRPVDAGPRQLFNSWATYTFTRGPIRGFGLGLGVNAASENTVTNTAATGTFTLPAYTLLNASVYYDVRRFRIGVKGNNLTDRTYFKGWSTVSMEAPRSILATVSYKL